MQPLPTNNQCPRCKEWFHTVHVCADSVKVRQCCDHCDDGDGHSVFPYYGVAPQRTHQPKGGMCCICAWQRRNCAALPFETMPVIGVDTATGANIVRCTEHLPIAKSTTLTPNVEVSG